jgi:hypothetical protein
MVVDRSYGSVESQLAPYAWDISIRSTPEGPYSGWPELVWDQPLIEPFGD